MLHNGAQIQDKSGDKRIYTAGWRYPRFPRIIRRGNHLTDFYAKVRAYYGRTWGRLYSKSELKWNKNRDSYQRVVLVVVWGGGQESPQRCVIKSLLISDTCPLARHCNSQSRYRKHWHTELRDFILQKKKKMKSDCSLLSYTLWRRQLRLTNICLFFFFNFGPSGVYEQFLVRTRRP